MINFFIVIERLYLKISISTRISIGMCLAEARDSHFDRLKKCQSKTNDCLVPSSIRTDSRVANLRCGPDRGHKRADHSLRGSSKTRWHSSRAEIAELVARSLS